MSNMMFRWHLSADVYPIVPILISLTRDISPNLYPSTAYQQMCGRTAPELLKEQIGLGPGEQGVGALLGVFWLKFALFPNF